MIGIIQLCYYINNNQFWISNPYEELSAGRTVQAPGIFKLLCDSIDIMPLRNTAYYQQQNRNMDSKRMSE